MINNKKNKTIQGILWSSIERFSLQGIQFLFGIIMARLLSPTDYGIIAMLLVFLQISQIFIDCGFTNALIQKKNRNEIDYSTVFYFNIFISVICYVIIFICSPFIAKFYHMPSISSVLRIIAITLIINAISSTHKTKLTINIDFKTQTKISLISVIISGIIGIFLAYNNYGVWALVYQSIINATLTSVFYIYITHWLPTPTFSLDSFKQLFSFGSKLVLSSLLHRIYYNLYSLVIGRKFTATDLGYYTRAEQLAIFPSNNINSVISRVTFPILSQVQDNDIKLKVSYRKYIRYTSLIIFPLMIGLASLAYPIVEILLTNKWIGVASLLQILCFDWMFDHLCLINSNLLYVKGRSDLVLKLEIFKKTIATIILFASIPFGIIGMCWGRVLYSLIATYINTYYTEKIISLSFWIQLKDILPYLTLSFLMGIFIYFLGFLNLNDWTYIIASFILGVFFYFIGLYIIQKEDIKELVKIMEKQCKS